MRKGADVAEKNEVGSEFQGLNIEVETKGAKTFQDVTLNVHYQVFVPVGSYTALIEGFDRGQIDIYLKDVSSNRTFMNTTAKTGGISQPHFIENDRLADEFEENRIHSRKKSFRLGDEIENLPEKGKFEVYVEYKNFKSNVERFSFSR